MREDRPVFAQLTDFMSWSMFSKCVKRYRQRYPTKALSLWSQFHCMLFAQLTSRDSLRDVTTCLRSQSHNLYRTGIGRVPARSTLADANERRDFRIFRDFALHLIAQARLLYAGDSLTMNVVEPVYAVDASTVDLCLTLFDWAPASKGRAGVKLHTVLDLRGNIPTVVDITGSRSSDVAFLDRLPLEAGSIYIMDRGFLDATRLMRFNASGAFFVIRAVKDLRCRVLESVKLELLPSNILADQRVTFAGQRTKHGYPVALRRVSVHDTLTGKTLVFLTNHFDLTAPQVSLLYRSRWQIELFFKCIKQHLKITSFIGNSANAVKIQIWSAISAYVLVAIVKKRLACKASMHEMLQAISVTLFEATPLRRLFAAIEEQDEDPTAQISLFEKNTGQ
jgi:hypothetical protein